MMKKYAFLLWVPVLLIWAGCGSKIDDADLIAKVGSTVLTRQEMETRMASEGYMPDQERTFVDQWIHRELLYQEARRLHLYQSEELQQELIRLEKELLINKLLERNYKEKIRLSEEEIRSYYDQNISDFTITQDESRIQHMLLENRSDANLALQEINAGNSFESVARNRSTDAFAESGGEMGYIRKGDVIPEIERYAFQLSADQVSPLIRTGFGYHIIKVLDRRKAGETRPLSEVRSEIMQRLRVVKEGQVYYDLLYQLQNQNKYYVYQPPIPTPVTDSVQTEPSGIQ